ncbi:amidohydrolase family protein [Cystobacter fuscus]|nr:amidohydrolase family protein [Cystobacter fuscus]
MPLVKRPVLKTPSAGMLLGVCFLFLSIALPLPGCVHGPESGPARSDEAVAFIGVNVVPMDSERVLPEQTVIVRDGLISAMGPSSAITVPAGARRIEAKGRYLMPGLSDFHIHLHSDEQLLSYLAHGVTTVFELNGTPRHLKLREQIAQRQVLGPRLYTSSPLMDGGPEGGIVVSVNSPEQARQAVVRQKRAGYDAIKVYDNVAPGVYEQLVATAREQKLPVMGHVPRTVGVDAVLRARQAFISHGIEYFLAGSRDESRIPGFALGTKAAGTTVVPDLSHVHTSLRMMEDLEGVFSDPEARYLSPKVMSDWRYSNPTRRVDVRQFSERQRAAYPYVQHLTLSLQRAGVRLVLGTNASDAGLFPGKTVHLELAELVRAGLSPYEALATSTRNPAAFIEEHVDPAARFGTVAVGQHADLLLLPGNPLEDVGQAGQALGVMVRGQWLTREQLQRLRDKVAESFNR